MPDESSLLVIRIAGQAYEGALFRRLRARCAEMERVRKSKEIHTRIVLRRKVHELRRWGTRALYGHLLRLERNPEVFGFVGHDVAEIVIRARRIQSDSRSILRGEVFHVGLQLDVRHIAGPNLPARDG